MNMLKPFDNTNNQQNNAIERKGKETYSFEKMKNRRWIDFQNPIENA